VHPLLGMRISKSQNELYQQQNHTSSDTENDYPYRLLIPVVVAIILAALP
jgi:hypothetical protein